MRAEKAVATHTKSREKVSTGQRFTETSSRFDAEGYPEQVEDLGDTATAADDVCTRAAYARNLATNKLGDMSAEQASPPTTSNA